MSCNTSSTTDLKLVQQMPRDFDYTCGRCHLFAIVFASMFNKPVTVWWDTDAWDENHDPIPGLCLVHAVVVHDSKNWDIEGSESTPENYCFNELEISEIQPNDLLSIAIAKGWPDFLAGEREHIKQRIVDIFGSRLDGFGTPTDVSILNF